MHLKRNHFSNHNHMVARVDAVRYYALQRPERAFEQWRATHTRSPIDPVKAPLREFGETCGNVALMLGQKADTKATLGQKMGQDTAAQVDANQN
jgi:hypothetical protein